MLLKKVSGIIPGALILHNQLVYSGNSKVKDQMMNLLDLMFKSRKKASEKITILHNDFGIDLTKNNRQQCKTPLAVIF